MIQFKVSVKGDENITKVINEITSIFTDGRLMRSIGEEMKRLIYGRTKSGYGVDADNKDPDTTRQVKLKPLSVSYKNTRNGIVIFTTKDGETVAFAIDKPVLGKLGSPNRSNLTFTGQMLDSIASRSNKYGVRLYFKSSRDDGLTNDQVAEFVSKDRPFFALTRDEYKVLMNLAERLIRQRIRKYI